MQPVRRASSAAGVVGTAVAAWFRPSVQNGEVNQLVSQWRRGTGEEPEAEAALCVLINLFKHARHPVTAFLLPGVWGVIFISGKKKKR